MQHQKRSTIHSTLIGIFAIEADRKQPCGTLRARSNLWQLPRLFRLRSMGKIAIFMASKSIGDVPSRILKLTYKSRTSYILGKIAVQQDDLDLAMQHLQRAYDLQYPGKPTHQSVASALYHQALVCMRRPTDRSKNDEQALSYLRQALTITQFNEPRRGDQGESARVKWQISKIWERQQRSADAATYRAAALRTKTELERTGLYPKAPDVEQSWDCFSDLVDR